MLERDLCPKGDILSLVRWQGWEPVKNLAPTAQEIVREKRYSADYKEKIHSMLSKMSTLAGTVHF